MMTNTEEHETHADPIDGSAMKLEAMLLCDKILRDDSGKVHLQGIFDKINAIQTPAVHGEMYLYFRFIADFSERADAGQDKLIFELIEPDGTIEQLPSPKPAVSEVGRVDGIFKFQGLPLRSWGEYAFRLRFNEIGVGVCGFEVVNPNQQGGEGETPTVH